MLTILSIIICNGASYGLQMRKPTRDIESEKKTREKMDSADQLRPLKIDFSGLDLSAAGTDKWAAARTLGMEAVQTYGCFEAVYDKLTPELHDAVFGKPMKDLFALPTEVKMKNTSNKPVHGYVGNDAGYETMYIDKVAERDGLDEFLALMWGDVGNPSFREAVHPFVQRLSGLELVIRRMVLEGLGVEKHLDEFVRSTVDVLRMSKYAKTNLQCHTDSTVLTIVCQRGADGLEVQTKDGSWLRPSPNSLTLLTGQALWAWSNGRIEPPWHRVAETGDETRYSAIFFVLPRDGYIWQAPEELVDDEHPLQFRPYEYVEAIKFTFSGAATNMGCALKEYCGVQEATTQEKLSIV